jgi:transposase-like protein
MSEKESTEKKIRNIRRQNRKKYSAEEKIRIVIEGLRGDESIAELCRREGIALDNHCFGARIQKYAAPKGGMQSQFVSAKSTK